MQIIDALLMIPLILGGYIGFQNGLFETTGKLLAAVAALVITVLSLHYLEAILLHFFASVLTGYGKIYSFILTFFIVLALFYGLIYFLSQKGFQKLKLEGLDNFFGGVVGVVRFGFFALIFVMLVHFLDTTHFVLSKGHKEKSVLYTGFEQINQFTLDFVLAHPNMVALKQEVQNLYSSKQ